MKTTLRSLAGLAFALAFAATSMSPAVAATAGSGAAATPATALVTIESGASSSRKCIGLANNGSIANGTRLVLWDCHGGADQTWYFENRFGRIDLRSGVPGYGISGKCVGTANSGSTANGTELVIWDCHGGADQNWAWATFADGSVELYNVPSSKCAGLANSGSTTNGTRLVVWDCHAHPDQHWWLNAR